MKFLTNIISAFLKSEDDRKRLYKVVIPSFAIHFFSGLLALALIFIMTRNLGPQQYGVYTYCFSIVFIIVNLSTYGICLMAVKETPSLVSRNKTGLWKGLHLWSAKLVLFICTALALLVAIFIAVSTFYFHILTETGYTIPLLLALLTTPFFGLMNYYAASLRGNHKIVFSLLPDNIMKPVFFLLSVGVLFAFSSELNITSALLLNLISFGGAALFAMIVFYKTAKFKDIQAENDVETWKKFLKSFLLLTVIISINSRMDILMLKYLKDSTQVGIYSVADRVANSLMIFLTIMNQVSAASMSRLHALEQKQKLQEMITKISRWVMLISLPVYIFIVIFSKWILSYFGPGFVNGQTALIIISTGQIISIAYGPAGILSLMTGNQKFAIIFTSINIFINFTLNLTLTPSLGIIGTAIASTVTSIAWNTGMFLTIRKKTGIRTWVLG